MRLQASLVLVLLSLILRTESQGGPQATQQDLCYRLRYKYDGVSDRLDSNGYALSQLVIPVSQFPSAHSKVVNDVCGGAKAGDTIPAGSSNCRDCKWSKSGQKNFNSCPSSTACLDEEDEFASCNGEGYVNGGSLFYAYNYPKGSSANTGYEKADTETIYFVQDANDNVWLVLTHDAPNSGGGQVGLSVTSSGLGGNVYVAQRDDYKSDSNSCPPNSGGDCYGWHPEDGEGTFYWKWIDCCTDGMVLGPIPTTSFSISLEYTNIVGLSYTQFGSYDSVAQNMEFREVDQADAVSGVLVEGFDCFDFCLGVSSCGECSAASACAWCDSTNECRSTETIEDNCPASDIIDDGCCSECESLSNCTECTAAAGCGWCADTNECMSGNDGQSCRTCEEFQFGPDGCPSASSTRSMSSTLTVTPSPTISSSPVPSPVAGPSGCKTVRPFDLLFVVDGSGSIEPPDWLQTLNFVYDAAAELDIGQGSLQAWAGVVQWSTWSWVNVPLENRTKTEFLNSVCANGVCETCYTCAPATHYGDDVDDGIEDCAAYISSLGGFPEYIGDGYCDSNAFAYNTPSCSFDGGDCCQSTCEPNGEFACGESSPYRCVDPNGSPVLDNANFLYWESLSSIMAETVKGCTATSEGCPHGASSCPAEPDSCCFENGACQIPQLLQATNPYPGLKAAQDQFHKSRADSQKFIIFTTDGVFNSDSVDNTESMATTLKEEGVTIFSVGIGSQTQNDQLEMVASDESFVFHVESFNSLADIINPLLETACEIVNSPSRTPSISASLSPTPSQTPSRTVPPESASVTASTSPAKSPTQTPSTTPAETPSTSTSPVETPSVSASATRSGTPEPSPSTTSSPTMSSSPAETPSVSSSPAETPSTSISPTTSVSPVETPSVSPTLSLSVSPSESLFSSPSTSPSHTPTISLSSSESPSVTVTTSSSPSVSSSETPSSSVTASRSVTPSSSVSPTTTGSTSVSSSETPSRTVSPSESPVETPSTSTSPVETPSTSASPVETPSQTVTPSGTPSPSTSETVTPSTSVTPTRSSTASSSTSVTPTPAESSSPSTTGSITVSPSRPPSVTPTSSVTPSETPTSSVTPSRSASTTETPSVTPSRSPSVTPSPSVSSSMSPSTSASPSTSVLIIPDSEFSRIITGDGTIGWSSQKQLEVPNEMQGDFASSLDSPTDLGVVVGAHSHTVDWGAGSVASGDVLIGSLADSGLTDRVSLSSMMGVFDSSIALADGSHFGDAVKGTSGVVIGNTLNLMVGSPRTSGHSGSFWFFLTSTEIQAAGEIGFPLSSSHSRYVELPDSSDASFRLFGSCFDVADNDKDGLSEVVVGAPGSQTLFAASGASGSFTYGGAVWVIGLTRVSDAIESRFAHQINAAAMSDLGYSMEDTAEFGYSVVTYQSTDTNLTLLVGAPGTNNNQGSVLLVDVSYTSSSFTVNTIIEISPHSSVPSGARFGSSLAIMPDFDFDGFPEVLIGASGDGGTGAAYLSSFANINFDFFTPEGSAYRRAELSTFSAIGNSAIPSDFSLSSGDNLGESAVFLGDVDADEKAEFALGSPAANGNDGAMYVFSVPIPAFAPSPEPASGGGGGGGAGIPAWIAGPILGAFALPALFMLMRRNSKNKDARLKKAFMKNFGEGPQEPDVDMLPVINHSSPLLAPDDFLGAIDLEQMLAAHVEQSPGNLANDLLLAAMDVPSPVLTNILAESLATDSPSQLASELYAATERVADQDGFDRLDSYRPEDLERTVTFATTEVTLSRLQQELLDAVMTPTVGDLHDYIISATTIQLRAGSSWSPGDHVAPPPENMLEELLLAAERRCIPDDLVDFLAKHVQAQ